MTINAKTKISALLAIGYWLVASSAFAGNISPSDLDHSAWSGGGGADIVSGVGVVGWIDFYNGDSVTVSDTAMTGTADAPQIGLIALDCSVITCTDAAVGAWGVSNDGAGNLSGWAWNDNIGWISFCGNTSVGSGAAGGCPASPTYQVEIDVASGDFGGWAWNDVIGWISFNCNNVGIGPQCPAPGSDDGRYKVKTTWAPASSVPDSDGGGPIGGGSGSGGGGGGYTTFDDGTYLISSTFDTKVQGGAALNTVMWLGKKPGETAVGIQIASSNDPDGPWTEDEDFYVGPGGTKATAYEAAPGKQIRLNSDNHNNKRYFRYKVYLHWDSGQTPQVEDVVINYSP